MSVSKQYLKSKPICKVTFTVPAEHAASVAVVGDFNNWNAEEALLKKLKNGSFKGTLNLPVEHTFEFRYVIDGEYINDEAADGYKWNDYAGTENALLIL